MVDGLWPSLAGSYLTTVFRLGSKMSICLASKMSSRAEGPFFSAPIGSARILDGLVTTSPCWIRPHALTFQRGDFRLDLFLAGAQAGFLIEPVDAFQAIEEVLFRLDLASQGNARVPVFPGALDAALGKAACPEQRGGTSPTAGPLGGD